MPLFRAAIFAVFLIAVPLHAADEPLYGPQPDWVENIDPAEPDPEKSGQAVQTLLSSYQVRFAAEGGESFHRMVNLVQTPQGMQALGTITIPWQPDHNALTIHRMHLIRDGEEIDLIARGQEFTVLRRENNLENAMLDGVLTAVIQPEGLAVGDIVEVAYSLRELPSEVPFRSENMAFLLPQAEIERVHDRFLWPADLDMQWIATGRMEGAELTRSGDMHELSLTLEDIEGEALPEDAPSRFAWQSIIQASGYGDWRTASTVLAEAYEDAQQFAPDSPIRAEIERIAAATGDPRERALAALRVVQERIRYVALGMGDAGYVPAPIERTWARRYGDCKGKTVLLLAMLDGLGIEAEPVLVSTVYGDAIEDWLPQLSLFDHVIVRATIDGEDYWMDGTRPGDRSLDLLRSSPHGMGLPVRAEGADLVDLPLVPPSEPLTEYVFVYDASEGIAGLVPARGRMIFRGDLATQLRIGIAQIGEEQMRESFMEEAGSSLTGGNMTEFEVEIDEATGDVSFVFSGQGRAFYWDDDSGAMRHRLDSDIFEWSTDFARDSEEHADLPFTLNFPFFNRMREEIILPPDAGDFEFEAETLDRTLAGTRFLRTTAIEDGRAVIVTSMMTLQNEIPAEEARAAAEEIEEIGAGQAYLVAPDDYEFTQADYRRSAGEEGEEGLDDYARANTLLADNDFAGALDAIDAALAARPDWTLALQLRGWILHALDRDADALATLNEAVEAAPEEVQSYRTRASIHEALGDLDSAVADIERALEESSDDTDLISQLGRYYAAQGNEADALAMAARLLATDREDPFHHAYQAALLERFERDDAAQRAYDRALALIDAEIAAAGEDAEESQLEKAYLLDMAGRTEESLALAESLLGDDPEPTTLNHLCWTRAMAGIELEEALANCQAALAPDPERPDIIDSLAWAKLRLGRVEEAIADFDRALALSPLMASSLYGRGYARLELGQVEAAREDIAEARRVSYDVDHSFAEHGLGVELPEE